MIGFDLGFRSEFLQSARQLEDPPHVFARCSVEVIFKIQLLELIRIANEQCRVNDRVVASITNLVLISSVSREKGLFESEDTDTVKLSSIHNSLRSGR